MAWLTQDVGGVPRWMILAALAGVLLVARRLITPRPRYSPPDGGLEAPVITIKRYRTVNRGRMAA